MDTGQPGPERGGWHWAPMPGEGGGGGMGVGHDSPVELRGHSVGARRTGASTSYRAHAGGAPEGAGHIQASGARGAVLAKETRPAL